MFMQNDIIFFVKKQLNRFVIVVFCRKDICKYSS